MRRSIRHSDDRATKPSLEAGIPDRILMAMRGDRVRGGLARALSISEVDKIRLEVVRAFPWSGPGGGTVEYSLNLGDTPSEVRTLHARLRPGGTDISGEPVLVDSIPLTPRERDQFFTGRRALYLSDLDMMISAFPLDFRMHWMVDLIDPQRMTRILQESARGALDIDHFSIIESPEVLGYRHGKRCTLLYRLQVQDGVEGEKREIPIIGKTQHDCRGRESFRQLEQLWNRQFKAESSRPPIIPRPLCHLPEYRIWLQERLAGVTLFDIREVESRHQAMAGTAELLSLFHRSGPILAGSYGPDDELSLLVKWAEYLRIVEPGSAELSEETLSILLQKGGDGDIREYEPAPVHRDFFDKQVIRNDDHYYLIDLDTVTMSDPAIDVGNFIAHIKLRAYQRYGSDHKTDRDVDLFLSTYLAGNPEVHPKRILFYEAASLFRLACLYAYRPRWSHLPAILLEESYTCSSEL